MNVFRDRLALLVASIAIMTSGPSVASPYCTDYDPSIRYLSVVVPEKMRLEHIADGFDEYRLQNPEMAKSLPPYVRFSVDAIKYASIDNFIEQLPISVLSKESSFLKRLSVMTLDKAVVDAMGLGVAGTRIVEPGAGLPEISDLEVQVVDVDGTFAQSDTPNFIFVSRELVEQIVKNAVQRHFGDVKGFEDHLKRILAMTDEEVRPLDRPEPTNFRNFVDFRVDSQDNTRFPIGQVIDNAATASSDNPYKQLRSFASEVVGELVFIGAHEVGHLRLGHHDQPRTECSDFLRYEKEADVFAARSLADFQFNMAPMTETDEPPKIASFASFFEYYRQAGFANDDTVTGCKYQKPQVRLSEVEAAYAARVSELIDQTFSSADYSTPNPTASICSVNGKTWKKPLDD